MTDSPATHLKKLIGRPAYQTFLLQTCMQAQMTEIALSKNELTRKLDELYRDWNQVSSKLEKDGKTQAVADFISHAQTQLAHASAKLTGFGATLAQATAGDSLVEQFIETADGELLTLAWTAVLEADLFTLATMTSYAENDITSSQNGPAVRKIFFDLLDQAGIKVISGGSSTRGFSGEQRGSLTFIIVEAGNAQQTGLKIARNRVFGYEDRPNGTTHSSAVVTGVLTTSPYNQFSERSEPNSDAEAVEALAEKIAAHLRAHYSQSE